MKTKLSLLFPLLVSTMHGAIIHSGTQDIAIPENFDGIYLDIETGFTATTEFSSWDFNPTLGGYATFNSSTFQPVRDPDPFTTSPLLAVPKEDLIHAGLFYLAGDGVSEDHMRTVGGSFEVGVPTYLGFQFVPEGSTSNLFGWMKVTFTINQPSGIIHEWAWEDNGTAITAGAVPEPSAAILGLISSALLISCRRNRCLR